MVKILLIDDSPEIGTLVALGLRPYQVHHELSASAGRHALANSHFDLALVDVSLPDGNGFALCSEISSNPLHTQLPLILLTSKDTTSDKVYGLNCGASDYVTKPFEMVELKARVDSQLRRQRSLSPENLKTSYFEIDNNFQRCFTFEDGKRRDIGLTPTEFRILMTLFKNRGTALSRDEIVNAVWTSQGMTIETKGLDTHIAHLRKKLGPLVGPKIASVYGKGYVFKD